MGCGGNCACGDNETTSTTATAEKTTEQHDAAEEDTCCQTGEAKKEGEQGPCC